jgi:hypothetical protein
VPLSTIIWIALLVVGPVRNVTSKTSLTQSVSAIAAVDNVIVKKNAPAAGKNRFLFI